ncbi:hypothetical protein RJ639_004595 [Escallonia herrerae]|uniref:Retrotransposon Copia-like N-terminal domain-containing protein n=1 Tax=Escallonia herrerae TaxID=1293975 RepID=A0AA88VZ35_9ASTE|nr:hypothetical protein RJ639_004595 [Escallonia herrerae]
MVGQQSDDTHIDGVKALKDSGAPKFESNTDPMDVDSWIQGIEKVWLLEQRKNEKDKKPYTWEMFKETFRKEYEPKSVRLQKKMDFIRIEQGSKLVAKYDMEFIDPSKFALELIADEESQARKFGNHPCHLLVPIKLNEANYPSWSKSMIHSLTAKNKIGFINGSIEQPLEKDQPTEYALWNQCSSMILSWLTHSVEPDLAKGVIHAKTAYQVWEDFKDQFSQKNAPAIYQIHKSLASFSQGLGYGKDDWLGGQVINNQRLIILFSPKLKNRMYMIHGYGDPNSEP